jgi:predicted DNA-binding transcriptional regulator AlpA
MTGVCIVTQTKALPIQWLIDLDEYYSFHKESELLKDFLSLDEALALVVFGVSKEALDVHLTHAGICDEDAIVIKMVAERFRKLATTSILAGAVQDPTSIGNWMKWASLKKYNVSHLTSSLKENTDVDIDPACHNPLVAGAKPVPVETHRTYNDDDWLTTKELMEYLGIKQATFTRKKARGLIPKHDSMGENNHKWRFRTIKHL